MLPYNTMNMKLLAAFVVAAVMASAVAARPLSATSSDAPALLGGSPAVQLDLCSVTQKPSMVLDVTEEVSRALPHTSQGFIPRTGNACTQPRPANSAWG